MTIKYTKIDQDEVREELIEELQKTDSFKNANFTGTVLYDLTNTLSYNASLMGFYLNNIANEPFIDNSKQYKNINRISNSLLYNPIGKGSAEVAIASKLSKDYVLRNTEGFVEIPTYSQFPSQKVDSDGNKFAFTNTKPLVIQVQQFGVKFLSNGDLKYVGEISSGGTLESSQMILEGQKKKPIQIVEDKTIAVLEEQIRSVAHDTLGTFTINTEYSLVAQKYQDTYVLVIMPKTTTVLDKEVARFTINDNREVQITQNFSSNKIYIGRTGMRNLVNTRFEIVRQIGDVTKVGRVRFIIPRYTPAFEVLFNGEVYTFSSDEEDIIISSDELESGQFDNEDINVVLDIDESAAKYYGSTLLLKNNSSLSESDIVIGVIPAANITNGNILASSGSDFFTGLTKSGSVGFNEGELSKRVVFDTPYDFGLSSSVIPFNNEKNYSVLIYADGNVRTFYTDKTTEGFIINIEPETGFEGTIYWKAVEYQRNSVKRELVDITSLQGLFDSTDDYAVMLQPGLNILAWSDNLNKNGFDIVSDVSFVGNVDYMVVPYKDLNEVDNPVLTGTEYFSSGGVEMTVIFDRAMPNANYQIFLQPENNVNVWFEGKTTEGFTLRCEEATDFVGKIDWQVYNSKLTGTITFGGGDLFIDGIEVEYNDIDETSYMGFVTQGLARMSLIEETGLINSGVNSVELDYDTDITINPGLSFVVNDDAISYRNIRAFVKINDTWVEFTEAEGYKGTVDKDSKVFHVRVNKDKKVTVKFGNNDNRGYDVFGKKVVILGLECVGEDGNIGEGVLNPTIIGSLNFHTSNVVTEDVEVAFIDLIKVKRDAFFDGDTTPTLIDYRNITVNSTDLKTVQLGTGIFGTEPEGVESIRKNAQISHITQKRLVTGDDYEITLKKEFEDFVVDVEVFNYSEARDVGLIPSDVDYRDYFNTLFFMMVPKFGRSFSLYQKETIQNYLDDKSKRMVGKDVMILEPTFVNIDTIISFAHKIDAIPSQIRNNITAGVIDFFSRENRALGETITSEAIKNNIISDDITQLNIQINRDADNSFTPQDYDVDIKPEDFEDQFKAVQERNLQDEVKKQIRNLAEKGLIQLKQPLFDVQYPSGEREWLLNGDVTLGRFEYPTLGDLVIERKTN
jgi:hypothetical protein